MRLRLQRDDSALTAVNVPLSEHSGAKHENLPIAAQAWADLKEMRRDMRNWDEYLKKDINCECGHIHNCQISDILVEKNAIKRLPELVIAGGYRKICIVSDIKTQAAAGDKVEETLKQHNIHYYKIVFETDALVPDETALELLEAQVDPECDLILAVGSGTINDLCKYFSFQRHMDYFIIATAPSMDGYASNVAPLIINNVKTTYEVGMPKAIIGELEILSKAPMSMITAGVGDILGKYVCLADWKLSQIINGEYHCSYVENLIRTSIETVVNASEKIKSRDEESVGAVMEALILSGIGMSYIGNSRPASGSEHHLSHYWEMMFLQADRPCAWHGTKVAVGTVIALGLYHRLEEFLADIDTAKASCFDEEKWKKNIEAAYGVAACGVIALEEKVHKNADSGVNARRKIIAEHREEILKMAAGLPDAGEIKTLLEEMGAPSLPKEIGVPPKMVENSILYAKELRNRYGLLQLLFDTGKLEYAAKTAQKKILVVVDMQNDFVDGALGTGEAVQIVDNVVKKIEEYRKFNCEVVFTMDTHTDLYLRTQEGEKLPVPHCIKGTAGWELCGKIKESADAANDRIYEKVTFGSDGFGRDLEQGIYREAAEVELCGLCTDICVISNAMLVKTFMPETLVTVDGSCCAGVTPASHRNALEAMKMCQVNVI